MSEWGGTFTKYTRVIGWRTAANLGNGATSIISAADDGRSVLSKKAVPHSKELTDARVCLNCTKPKCEGAYECYLREKAKMEAKKNE